MHKTIYNADEKIPDHLDYAYILTRDGFYLKKRMPLLEAIVRLLNARILCSMAFQAMHIHGLEARDTITDNALWICWNQ